MSTEAFKPGAERGTVLEIAQAYAEAGLSVIPILPDGSKRPAWEVLPKNEEGKPTWKRFQKEIAGSDEILSLFGSNGGVGVAIVCGQVSGGLEDTDFDDIKVYTAWNDLIIKQGGKDLLDRLVKIQTPRPGVVVLYRCHEKIEGSQKLAQRAEGEEIKTLIETKGEGGYFLAPGCPPACHETKRKYVLKRGDILNPPVITAAERALLLDTARTFNEYIEPANIHRPAFAPNGNGSRPGDDYSQRTAWREILEPEGWKFLFESGHTGYWRRPGKQIGMSATTNFGGSDLFYNFSSNAPHFEAGQSYSKFAAYARLNHNGDYQAAARALFEKGYGKRHIPEAPPIDGNSRPHEPDAAPATFTPPDFWKLLDVADVENWDCQPLEWIIEHILAKGNLVFVAADTQCGKTFLAFYVLLKILTGGLLFGKFRIYPIKKVLYLLLEDPDRRAKKRILDMRRDIRVKPGQFMMYVAPGLTVNDELHWAWLKEFIANGQYDLVVLDTYQKATPGISSFDDVKQGPILHKLSNITRELSAAFWIHDHYRKEAGGRKRRELDLSSLKGTGGKPQNADCFILMERTGDTIKVLVSSKESDQKPRFLLKVSPEGSDEEKFTYIGDLEDAANEMRAKGQANRERVYQAVGTNWMSKKEIKLATGLSSSAVSDHIAALVCDGKLQKTGENTKTRYRRSSGEENNLFRTVE